MTKREVACARRKKGERERSAQGEEFLIDRLPIFSVLTKVVEDVFNRNRKGKNPQRERMRGKKGGSVAREKSLNQPKKSGL